MKIHNVEECKQWVSYRNSYSSIRNKMFMFEPEIISETGHERRLALLHIVDITGKCFQHNEERVIRNLDKVKNNYPKLEILLDKLHVFFCPYPAVDTANACANELMITYYARGTQIPYCMTDYITVHELGHVVQYNLCKGDKFNEYRKLRDPNDEYDTVDWDGDPQEWFAEDFRWFFGTDQGDKYWGLSISKPNDEVKDFILSL